MAMKETEIRPAPLFDELLACSREDIKTFFSDPSRFRYVPCPACEADQPIEVIEKFGFHYVVCAVCDSLYVSPRPSEEDHIKFLIGSSANEFFSSHFYKETALARREKIYRPRAEVAAGLARQLGNGVSDYLVDVGSGFGIFLEEARNTNAFLKVGGVEPVHSLAEDSRRRGFPILEKTMEAVRPEDIEPSFMTAFEVVEHLLAPEVFLQAMHKVLKPGGVILFTTLTISGFDLQILWQNSKTIYPPQHLNFMSVTGLQRLLERSGFENILIETPGELDVDIVRNMALADSSIELPRFVRLLIHSDEGTRQNFQNFLKANRMSSHVRCVARKPQGELR
jgi:SAM-dependent methyltransferase